jgi:hypothetical protein
MQDASINVISTQHHCYDFFLWYTSNAVMLRKPLNAIKCTHLSLAMSYFPRHLAEVYTLLVESIQQLQKIPFIT